MKRLLSIISLLSIIGFSSCKHELIYPDNADNTNNNGNNNGGGNNGGGNNGGGNNGGGNNGGETPEDTIVCFETEILPLFQSSCAMSGCHDAITHEEGIRLYTYSGIMQEIVPFQPTEGDIMESITDNDPDKIMPPPPHSPLSSTQIALIEQWIMQGAQNTTDCAGSACDSTAFAYSADIVPIMSTFCNGCHSGNFPSAGIVTSTHAGLSAIATSGSLLGSIEHVSSYSAMPKNAAMLDICNRTKIKKWILAGAPNN
jgi:hypothetical protein